MIRKMRFQDISEIKEIDKMCFKTDDKRSTEGIEGYIRQNLSIVYEINNKVVGYNFIHQCGSFGWFGSFGVHPKYQGKGVGKALIVETIKILKDDQKVSTIGLNTMPASQYNVGFYMSLGFTPHKLSLNLVKNINSSKVLEGPNGYNLEQLDVSEETNYLHLKNSLQEMANKIFNGFDLTSELNLIKYKNFGIVFTLEFNNKIHGIVICHTKPMRGLATKNLNIRLVIIDAAVDYNLAMDSILYKCINYANKTNYESISIDCNTYNADMCRYLICNHNFKIQKNQVMLLMGDDNPFINDKTILLMRFSG